MIVVTEMIAYLAGPLEAFSNGWVVAQNYIITVDSAHIIVVIVDYNQFHNIGTISFSPSCISWFRFVNGQQEVNLFFCLGNGLLPSLLNENSYVPNLQSLKVFGRFNLFFLAVSQAAVPFASRWVNSFSLVYQLSI